MGWIIFFGIVALVALFAWLANQSQVKALQGAESTFTMMLDELSKNPTDVAAHQRFLRDLATEPVKTHLPNARSEVAYQTALAILEQNPNSLPARTFALAVGRWHFGRSRADKKVALYDEQAMQNDILLRSQTESPKTPVPELVAGKQ